MKKFIYDYRVAILCFEFMYMMILISCLGE